MNFSLLLQCAEFDKLDESLHAVETQYEATPKASPEHLEAKELPNQVLMSKPNDDHKMEACNGRHIRSIRQQPQRQLVNGTVPSRIKISVHVSTGYKVSMVVDIVVTTVRAVKFRASSATGIKPSYLRVMMDGKELKDDSITLYSLGMYVVAVVFGGADI